MALYRSLLPLPDTEEGTGLARNFCEDRDPVAAESCSVSDDNQTFSFILKKRKSAAEPRDEDPSPGSFSPQSHPTKSRTAVRKRKAAGPADTRYCSLV